MSRRVRKAKRAHHLSRVGTALRAFAHPTNHSSLIPLSLNTSVQRFIPGEDATGDGSSVNVRALYQRCPHLGCKPNPCVKNFWLECPCHGSRYDRLGIKADGVRFGPAPRSMDRFSANVKDDGTLWLDTGKITLGPLPVALGQPGLIPPKTPTGCI